MQSTVIICPVCNSEFDYRPGPATPVRHGRTWLWTRRRLRFLRRVEQRLTRALYKRISIGVSSAALLKTLDTRVHTSLHSIESNLVELNASVAMLRAGQVAGQFAGHAAHDAGSDRPAALPRGRFIPLSGEMLVRTGSGWVFTDIEDHALIHRLAEAGDDFEPGTFKVIRALVTPGDLAADVGARAGLTTLAMAAAAGSAGRVFAVEPDMRSAELLRKTVALNGLAGVVSVVECRAGSGPAEDAGPVRVGGRRQDRTSAREAETNVNVERLDDLLPASSLPALVRIGAGDEAPEVLAGMERILARAPDLAVISKFWPGALRREAVSPAAWMAAFRERGFAPWVIDEADGAIRRADLPALEGGAEVNLLMLRGDPRRRPRLLVKP